MGRPRATRIPIDLPAVLDGHSGRDYRITNLSLGGVFVTGVTLAIDTRVGIMFTAPPHVPEFHAACTTRWSTAEGTGLSFDDLPSADVDRLAYLIRYVLSRMQ